MTEFSKQVITTKHIWLFSLWSFCIKLDDLWLGLYVRYINTLLLFSSLFPPPGGMVALWLVHQTPEQAVWVQALVRDIMLCSWERHLTVTVPLSTQVYKWVPATLMLGGNPAMDQHPIQGGVEILSVASCYRNQDKLRPDGPLGLNADFTYLPLHSVKIKVMISGLKNEPSTTSRVTF